MELAAKVDKSDNEDLSNAFMKFILTEEFQNIIPLNNWSAVELLKKIGQ